MIERIEQEVDQLERHIRILEIVLENEPIGITKISDKTGEPHDKVRYSLRSLEEEGSIEPTSQGPTTTNKTEDFVTAYNTQIDTIVNCLQRLREGKQTQLQVQLGWINPEQAKPRYSHMRTRQKGKCPEPDFTNRTSRISWTPQTAASSTDIVRRLITVECDSCQVGTWIA